MSPQKKGPKKKKHPVNISVTVSFILTKVNVNCKVLLNQPQRY